MADVLTSNLPLENAKLDDFDAESTSDADARARDAGSPTGEDEEMADLFGGDEEELEDRVSEGEQLPSEELERRRALEYEEEEIPPELAVEVKEAEVSFPNLPQPQSSNGEKWVIKIPNFVKLDSKPFHADTYIGPEHEDEELQHIDIRERSMTIKLRVENALRWRWTKDQHGNDTRQSNSRIVRWSDGSLSLRLGKELFDINPSIDNTGGVARKSYGGSQQQSASQSTVAPGGKSEGLTYLVAQHKRSQVLQSEALITGYMSLRPTGMQSDTHRMLVRAVGQKHSKISRLRMTADPTMDPEREQKELAKQHAKKTAKKRTREDDPLGAGIGRSRNRGGSRREAMYSDEEDDDDVFGSDNEQPSSRRQTRRQSNYAAEDDGFLVEDESDEEDENGNSSPKKKRKKVAIEEPEDQEEDPLDVMDARIEARNSHKASDAMEVESEEDEEEKEEDEPEVKVRRGTGRRRRAVYDDDDDDDE